MNPSHTLPPSAAAPAVLESLRPSARMPVLFVGHGSPMNVIEDTAWRFNWRDLGQELLARPERPQLIVCISAHWLTQGGWCLLGMAQPRTIHDFGGFPRVLYEQRYPAPGAPAVARTLAAQLRSPATGEPLRLDEHKWGLDHGAWGVLLPMFPAADIPVLQLSMDYSRPPAEHFALGQQLRALRDQGVLIVASGNIVHNLGYMRTGAGINATYPWPMRLMRRSPSWCAKTAWPSWRSSSNGARPNRWPSCHTPRTSIFCPCCTPPGRWSQARACAFSTRVSKLRRSPCAPSPGACERQAWARQISASPRLNNY